MFVSRRKILTAIVFVIVLLSVLDSVEVAIGAGGTEATWWNFSWKHRVSIRVVENSGNTLTDFQVFVSLDTASLIGAGKMQANGSDIRFTDSAGNGIPYWIESGINSGNTTILIRTPLVPASSAETVYMYYGNPTAISMSNASAVFDFFDDFLGTELDSGKWTWRTFRATNGEPLGPGNGSVAVGNSIVSVVSPGVPNPAYQRITQLTSLMNFTSPVIVEGNISIPNWGGYGPGLGGYRGALAGLFAGGNGVGFFVAGEQNNGPWVANESNVTYASDYSDTSVDFRIYKILWKTDSAKFYKDGKFHEELTTNVPNASLPISFQTSHWGDTYSHQSIVNADWVRVRKYASPEPTCLMRGEETFLDFPVPWETETYHVTTISNSTITGFSFSQPSKQISFNVTGFSGTIGFCNVSIPKSLLTGNPWNITADGVPITDFTQSTNETHTFLHFTYAYAGAHHVIIEGTWAVPEFPSFLILPLFMFATLLAIKVRKRKHTLVPDRR